MELLCSRWRKVTKTYICILFLKVPQLLLEGLIYLDFSQASAFLQNSTKYNCVSYRTECSAIKMNTNILYQTQGNATLQFK